MKIGRVLMFVLSAAVALPQTVISPPGLGAVRDPSGGLHAVIGVAGNFLIADTVISNVVSAGFSGTAGIVKTATELLVLNASNQVVSRYDAPEGPALFAFDPDGRPALAYCSGTLFRFDGSRPTPATWIGEVVSIASDSVLLRRDDGLWIVRSGNEARVADVGGPALLRQNGDLLFTRDSKIVLRGANGSERSIAAGFDIESFEQIGRDWIALREAGGGRLFALRIAPDSLELYQLPEVAQ